MEPFMGHWEGSRFLYSFELAQKVLSSLIIFLQIVKYNSAGAILKTPKSCHAV